MTDEMKQEILSILQGKGSPGQKFRSGGNGLDQYRSGVLFRAAGRTSKAALTG